MADTRGFEVVAEFGRSFLRKVMRAAWKSGGDETDPNVIPEFFDIPAGESFGGWELADGHVQIPQDGLDIEMAPDVNGVEMKFQLDIQVEVEDPPVPSARLFDMTAEAGVRAPVGLIGDSATNVGILLDSLPLGNVSASLTSGDPVAPLLDAATAEMVHEMYRANGPAFPHTIDRQNQSLSYSGFNAYRADVFLELFDDPLPPAPGEVDRRILVSRPDPSHLEISIPLRLRVSEIEKTASLAPTLVHPFAITSRLVIKAPYNASPGSVTAQLSAATVSAGAIAPVSGSEGTNYNTNNSRLFGQLGTIVAEQLKKEGEAMVKAMSDVSFSYPTVAQIEAKIREIFHARMTGRGALSVWTPAAGGTEPQIDDVAVKALPTALALGINAGSGADANGLADFIPSSREFAIALSGAAVLEFIDSSISDRFGSLPHRFNDVDGHDADLNSLNRSLTSGAIHLWGDVTVIDAIAGKIDVDADFEVDVGLHWEDNADGTQRIVADSGDPDVDVGLLGWILAFILVLLSPAGLIGAVIVVVVALVVEATAERVGGRLVEDAAGGIAGMEALPEQLEHIGKVDADFENPIEINPDGIVFSG